MKKILALLISGGLVFASGMAMAESHEGESDEANVATPIEMYACKYNEGKGRDDVRKVHKQWNAWADKQGMNDYSAWHLDPYYTSPQQEFDAIWLGGSSKAKAMGAAQDKWLAGGGKVQEAFNEVITCDTHAAYAVLQMKKPPKRDNPSNVVITFSDCTMSEGVTFDDLYMPLKEWGEYKGANGSTAGMWVFFPAFGGGGEKFDFKWATAYQNLEDMGADWDQFSESGWQKANELFPGTIDCDSARAYLATNVRMAEDSE